MTLRPMSSEAIEKRSIIITILASGLFGTLGIAISIASHSGAVFLDGLFSLTFSVVGLLTLYVSRLVSRPSDESYPFGYATFEPMLNLFKGVLIGFALVWAVWTSVTTMLQGGQEVTAEGGIIYAAIAVVGGAIIVIVLKKYAKQSGSPIVEVDAKNWTIDTLISAAVGIAFVATLLMQNSDWAEFALYADPIIILAICAIAAPQPFQTIRDNMRQLVGKAPPKDVQDKVAELVEEAIADVAHDETHLRIVDVGRYIHLHIYVIVASDMSENIDIRRHDEIRRRIYDHVSREYRHLSLDVGFTMDRRWALNSVPSEDHDTVVVATDSNEAEAK